jgi:hypothetical protein
MFYSCQIGKWTLLNKLINFTENKFRTHVWIAGCETKLNFHALLERNSKAHNILAEAIYQRPSKKGIFLYYEIGIETLLRLTMEQQIKYAFLYRRLWCHSTSPAANSAALK